MKHILYRNFVNPSITIEDREKKAKVYNLNFNGPLAKEFKKVVKQVLKEIRLNGYYMQGELVPHAPQRISVDAECDYLDRLAQALLDADTRADKLTELRKMHAFASVMMGKVDFTRYTLSRVQK